MHWDLCCLGTGTGTGTGMNAGTRFFKNLRYKQVCVCVYVRKLGGVTAAQIEADKAPENRGLDHQRRDNKGKRTPKTTRM